MTSGQTPASASHCSAIGSTRATEATSLNPEHLEKLRTCGLSSDHANQLGWSSLLNRNLLIPYLKPDGSPETKRDGNPFTRERLSVQEREKRKQRGESKPPRYLSPPKEGSRLYHSHLAIEKGNYTERLNDIYVPIRLTEGELKTESATIHDPERITIGLSGVWGWVDRYDGGEDSRPLVDFDGLKLKDREVRLCFDSDFRDNQQVLAALKGLATFLAEKSAYVLVEVLPHGLKHVPHSFKDRLGLDDLIFRHGAETFREIASIARPAFKTVRKQGEDVKIWDFNPQPRDTRERNAYLYGLLGQDWRVSPDGKDHWQRWTGSHWESVSGDDRIVQEIERFADIQGWENRELPVVRSLVAAFRRRIERASEHHPRNLLPFANGCLNITENRLIPHDRKHCNSWSLPFNYNNSAECPRIQAFLSDRLGEAENVATFRAFLRTLLTGDHFKGFLELVGGGDTGKTVLATIARAMVGDGNYAAGTLKRLEDQSQRFETIRYRNKRLAIFSEAETYSGPVPVLKAMTGRDAIPAEVKNGRTLEYTFTGAVLVVGNDSIRASDPSGATINRRRTLYVERPVAPENQRTMLEPDGLGGWTGELADELPGLVVWSLAMPAEDARRALARNPSSPGRVASELRNLLETDHLAAWADARLVWAPQATPIQVGGAESGTTALYGSYRHWITNQGANVSPLSLKVFKRKLVGLLRDTLGLPLPGGDVTQGDYRERGKGSVVPSLAWRAGDDDTTEPGVIRHAYQVRLAEPSPETPVGNGSARSGTDRERQEPSRERMERMERVEQLSSKGAKNQNGPLIGEIAAPSVPSVPSVPYKGSCRSAAVPDPFPSVPDRSRTDGGEPVTVDGQPGWRLPGAWPQGNGPTVKVLVTDPDEQSRLVERSRIRRLNAA